MPFPNFVGKHAHDAVFHPQDLITYFRKEQMLPEMVPPRGVIFCYERSLFRQILTQEETESVTPSFHLLKQTGGRIAVCGDFGIGDSLAELVWDPHFGSELVSAGLLTLYQTACATLA